MLPRLPFIAFGRPGWLLLWLLAGCASRHPAAPALPPATSPPAALLRLQQELAVLLPAVPPDSATPRRGFIAFVVADSAIRPPTLAGARQQLREAPDLLNRLAETNYFRPRLGELARRDTAAGRLQRLLQAHPDYDLGWRWLADLQPADSVALRLLGRAIRLNPQVGNYYLARARRLAQAGRYRAALPDYQQGIARTPAPWQALQELAGTYGLLHDDAHVAATWDSLLAAQRRALPGVRRRAAAAPFGPDSVRQMQQAIGYGYLSRALYFIEERHLPARACPDLARAAAAGVAEAPALRRQYCR